MPESTEVCLCKEITKKFENVYKGNIVKVCEEIGRKNLIQGEWTCLIEKVSFSGKKEKNHEKTIEDVCKYFSVNRSKSAKILSIVTGKSKKEIY